MPGDSEQPVTVGDLFFNRSNLIVNGKPVPGPYRPATVADLVSALRAEKLERIAELLFQLDAGGLSQLVKFSKMDDETQDYWREMAGAFLDALAEAQPFPPAGG